MTMTTTKRRSKYFDKVGAAITDINPLTSNQADYLTAIQTSPQVVCFGPAGTGKTYIASVVAANLYKSKAIDKIILTRPNIPTGRSLGYFPGTLFEKMAEWCAPVLEVLKQEMGPGMLDTAIKNNNLELVPFETMRGRSFSNTFCILDEAQNTEREEMKMFVTRIGEDSTVIINGDISQSDLKKESGLAEITRMIKTYKLPIPIVEFTIDDIVRSGLCKRWVQAYIEEEKKR
jgi:phosphate starvation-inducible protein PhoH and related proteins